MAEAENKYGILLETCEAGTLCRQEIEDSIRVDLTNKWKVVITEIKQKISDASKDTSEEIASRWTEMENCQKDHPCCSVPEVEIRNNRMRIDMVR